MAEKRQDPAWRKLESDRANRWNKANRHKTRVNAKASRDRTREKVSARNRRWREANREKRRQDFRNWVLANPDKAREYGRRWRAKNAQYAKDKLKRLTRDYADASKTNRRARTKGLKDRVSEAALKRIRENARNVCPNCMQFGDLEYDHIVPVAKGGRHVVENIQMLCRPCNMDKSTHDPVLWAWTNRRRRVAL